MHFGANMKLPFLFYGYLIIASIHFSCKTKTYVKMRLSTQNYCYETSNHDTICLDVQKNANPANISNLLIGLGGKGLLIFTGWEMSGKDILNEKYLTDYSILKALSEFKIIALYVDDRTKISSTDSTTVGQINASFQMKNYRSTSQPQYIVFENGKMVCSEIGLIEKHQVLQFLTDCKVK